MNTITYRYKIPFLISLVVGLALVALKGETYWFNAIMAFAGAIFGAVFIDMEYILYSYIVDPLSDQARKVKGYLAPKDIKGLVKFLNESEYSFGELSVRSIFFQGLLFVFSIYVITTNSWVFVQTLTLAMFANLLYAQFIEYQKTGTLQRWFWIYNGNLSKNLYLVYMVIMIILMILQYTFL